jgi:hypothetical protein
VTSLFTLAADRLDGAAGIVGRRWLTAVQMFSIGRLTSHLVPLVPSRFIAVTGRGPNNDSNECGKTTFLGAIALLCGDPYWGLAGGNRLAAGLLFNPDPAGANRDDNPPAETGYIVGLFEEPDGTDQLSVWLRISASSPIRVRWAPGAHVVLADTEAARLRAADATWASLGTDKELKSNFAGALYGDAPRCLAWLEARAEEVETKPTLLAANLAGFTPSHIGQELVTLCGRANAAEEDVEQRRVLDQLQRDLAERRRDDETAQAREELQLDGIRRRADAAGMVADAVGAWRLHFARGWLEALERLEQIDAGRAEAARLIAGTSEVLEIARANQRAAGDTAKLRRAYDTAEQAWSDANQAHERASRAEWDAERALREAEQRRNELTIAAAAWDGASVKEATAAAEAAYEAAADADFAARAALGGVAEAERDVEAVRAGRSGKAGAAVGRLHDAAPSAAVLLDAIAVAGDARDVWEPRLALYADAVTVTAADRDAAVRAAEPGDIIVSSPDAPLPDGIDAGPSEATGFLQALAGRYGSDGAVAFEPAGVTVVGGFRAPITGRAARVAAAEAALALAVERLADAREAHRMATAAVADGDRRLAAATAAAEADTARAAVAAAAGAMTAARTLTAAAKVEATAAKEARDEALINLENARARAELAAGRVRQLEEELTRHQKTATQLDQDADRLNIVYWMTGWGGDNQDAAREALIADSAARGAELTAHSYRKLATDNVAMVLGQLGFADPQDAPTPEIAAAVRDRADIARATQPDTTQRLLDALNIWLAEATEMDALNAERIDNDRVARHHGITTAAETCAQAEAALAVIQDAIVRSVRTRLDAVARELDRLNRAAGKFGAELDVDIHAPERPDDRWRWEVVPRWRRGPTGRMLDYRTITNSAQAKLFSVHLVVAALFASGEGRGSLLILDELGNSLGAQHRREVLRALADVAAAEGITVLGTCQDDLLLKAAEVCGEEIVFERASASDVVNAPVRVWGYDDNRARTEGIADAHRAGRRLD